MKLTNFLLATLVAASLGACGSADEMDDSNIGAALSGSSGGGATVPATTTPTIQTADLQATVQFDFATSWDMDIDFTLPLTNTYMSLCTDYTKSVSGMVDVKFDSCIVRAPITDGQYTSQDLPMTNEIDSLIAVLIDYANPATPMYVEFTVAPGKQSLDWSEGVNL